MTRRAGTPEAATAEEPEQGQGQEQATPGDPRAAAAAAHLRYVNDHDPGIRRRRTGRGFTYISPKGQRVTDEQTLARIRSLAIPPAWTQVWICPCANGHIQATGRDKKGRKQYRYHDRWRAVRDLTKYERMIAFGEALPAMRKQVELDLAERGLTRERVLATVVRLLDETHIRIGNQEYARRNKSYGLTTLRHRHVQVRGATIVFHFVGKAGKEHELVLRDPRLARIVRRCQDLPGHELFQYIDEAGRRQTISSDDVNAYLRAISGKDFTAKDFRTWAGTVLALDDLHELGAAETTSRAERNVREAVKRTAAALGNTPAVCRRSYIHPAVIERYLTGDLPPRLWSGRVRQGLTREEQAVLRLLRERRAATDAPAA